ncbi:MAG: putative bifunctional diguanylate cyclase/phosphodiesterase [Frankia sp.]
MSGAPPRPPASPDLPPSGTRARARNVNLVVASVCSAGLICLTITSLIASSRPIPSVASFAAAAGVIFLGEMPLLRIRVQGQRVSMATGEATFVVALAIVPGFWLVPTVTAVVLVLHAIRRVAPIKTLFNGAAFAVGIGLGGLVAHALGGTAALPAAAGYPAAAAGAVVYGIWTLVPVTAVVSAASGVPWRTQLLEAFASRRIPMAACSATVGVVILALAHWNPISLVVVPPVLLGLWSAYRANVRSVEQRNDWRELNAAAKDLADFDDRTGLSRVHDRAGQIFGATTVKLHLDPVSAEELAELSTEPRLVPVADAPQSRLDGLRSRMRWTNISGRNAPLMAGRRPIGELRLTFARPVAWTEHDDQVLAAFAHTLSSAIVRGRLYEQARRQAVEKAHEATHDALTGLGNRRLLLESAGQLLAAGGPDCFGLLLIDLDRFKEVNDTLGHSAGDRLLRGIAHRLRDSVRTGDVVTRLGGDEFAVLVTGIDHPAQAESVAADLAEVLARPVEVDGLRLAVEGSVGVAIFPEDGQNAEELLSRADIAMYKAKGSHPRWQRYEAGRDGSTLDRLALVAELRPAIDEGQLVLYYQPQVELKTGRVTGVEALVRWKHPVRGLLTPETFVPAVEQSGFVQEFTRAILRQALEACAGWREAGYDVGVSVNLSARNLLNTDLPGEVAQLLLTYKIPAPALTLEITETAMMADPDTAKQLLVSLSDIGVRIAVDDFGTGYSSLTLLQRCVLHEVKVDRGFVQRLLLERSDAAIVAATIQLAHSLGLTVVAEGIESQDLLEALAALRCDFGQGLHIGSAMPLTALTDWFDHEATTVHIERGPDARILPLHPRRPATG